MSDQSDHDSPQSKRSAEADDVRHDRVGPAGPDLEGPDRRAGEDVLPPDDEAAAGTDLARGGVGTVEPNEPA